MFDLEQSIAEWRNQMWDAGIESPVPLHELENHLREEIERQMKLGINGQQAFAEAVQGMGKADLMKNEFKKLEETKKAREAKLAEIAILAVTSLGALIMGGFFLFRYQGFAELTSSQQLSGLAAVATFALLIWGGRLSHGIFPAIHARQIRDVLCIAGGGLIAFFGLAGFKIILPQHDFTASQLLMAILWGLLLPMGAGIGFELGNRTRRAENITASSIT